MSDLHDLLERHASGYEPPSDLMGRVRERRRCRDRNRRVISATIPVVVAALLVGSLANVLNRPDAILVTPPPRPFEGTWVGMDVDGSSQTMDIQFLEDERYRVEISDDSAGVCSGAPSTMSGTGRIENGALVVPAPTFTCDDRTTPAPVEGASVEQSLRDYTLDYSAESETLSDSIGVLWSRPDDTGAVDPVEPPASGEMWPQASLDEVREAQERANAGDPAVAWQVAPAMVNDTAPPGDAAIFTRYLEQVLGWESVRWGDQVGLTWNADCAGGNAGPGCTSYEIGFVRCATGQPNPLYPEDGIHGDVPDDVDGTTCAPTLDDVTYETLTVVVSQPVRKGPKGIWVVTDSYPASVFRQTPPLSQAEVADVVEKFLQARVDGKGAEEHAESSWGDVPLQYTASNGSRYNRFDYDLHGPAWPSGGFEVTIRLHADNGNTVVAQEFGVENAERDGLLVDFELKSTTVNGQHLPEPYEIFDGEVTFSVAPPWYGFFDYGPNTIALTHPERNADFAVLYDPSSVGTGCAQGPALAAAEALAQYIRADPDLEVTKPVAAPVGGLDALQLDVVAAAGASVCDEAGTPLVIDGHQARGPFLEPGHRMRLYLLDLPKGSSARTLAITLVAPEANFETVLAEAPEILDSFKFRTP